MSLPTLRSQLAVQLDAVFVRHWGGDDAASIDINGQVTVTGLVDIETDAQQLLLGGPNEKQQAIIHIQASQLGDISFPTDYDVSCPITITYQDGTTLYYELVSQAVSPDRNMIDLTTQSIK